MAERLYSFKESHVRVKKEVKLKEPLLVVGLPGIGFVSKLAADHLIRQLKAEHFATLYSPTFPNQVLALKSGNLKLFSMRFYYKKMKKRDLVILKGDVQPLTVEGQYEVSSKILDFFKSLGGTDVLAMAGYAVNKKSEKPTVYCASTSKSMLKKFLSLGAKQQDAVIPIVGMAGLVPAIARMFQIRGACLLVETPGQALDAHGASTLLELLSKMIGEKIEVKKLMGRAAKAEKFLKKMEEQARTDQQAAMATSEGTKKELTYIH